MQDNNTTIQVGTILVTDFGATMQLPAFYKVTKRTAKTVHLTRLNTRNIDGDGMMGHCIPTSEEQPEDSYEARLTARVKVDNTYAMSEYAKNTGKRLYFYIWHGRPVMYNHWD